MVKSSKYLVFVLLFGIGLLHSCGGDSENIIDCLFESRNVNLDHTIDANDPKKVKLVITYTGENSLDNSVRWDFGDGVTTTGNGKSIEHIYAAAGTYKVKAKVTTRRGDAFCNVEVDENVNIN